ncbi:MAG TPA: O-antigen ligase family protein [Rubricoccaceae bacterium]|jgi:hypothetical protein
MNLDFAPTGHAFDRGLTSRGRRAGDRYMLWLGGVLLGYALLSRSFAYIGVPPLFIGEIMIVFGLGAVVRSGRPLALFTQPAAWAMAALVVLAAARTVPFVGEWGLDAPRDFMMIGYAVYAVIAGALVVAQPDRLAVLLTRYRTFVTVMVSLVAVFYLAFKTAETSIPLFPGASNVRLIEAKGGDIMVHLCGITVFLILGMMRRRPALMLALAATTAIVVASNRGGMVAYVAGCGVAYAMRPPEARVGRLVYAFVLFVALGLLAGPLASINGGGRSISVDQIVLNVKSVFGQGDEHLDGTKKWRLLWWTKIVGYTIDGPYFWTGRGFGINLAVADGFDVVKELRSPHNGHMTVLARMGVPGLALWLSMLGLWAAALLRQWLRARKAGRHRWMALFAFLAAYTAAILLNASFDVYLEGPMGGIWFWTVFGLGLAACHLHAHRPDVLLDSAAPLDDDRDDHTDGPADPDADRSAVPVWSWGELAEPAFVAGAAARPRPAPGTVRRERDPVG